MKPQPLNSTEDTLSNTEWDRESKSPEAIDHDSEKLDDSCSAVEEESDQELVGNSSKESEWWSAFQDVLFEVPRERTKLTRQQKREVRSQYSSVELLDNLHLDMTTKEFSELQQK